MGGLGHPNTLGFYAGASLLFSVIFARKGFIPWHYVVIWVVIWLITMYFCLSRTSMALTFIGLASIMSDKLLQRGNIPRFAVIAALGLACLFYFELSGGLESLAGNSLRSVSKSGDTAELTSLTGRSKIWKYGISRIAESPLTGHGFGTQRFVMDEYFYHCHNIVLNATLGSGIFSGLIMLTCIVYLFYRLFRKTDYFLRGFVPLFVIGGLVESMVFSPAPSLEMMLFFGLVLWQVVDPKPSQSEWQYEEAWNEWH